MSGGFPQEWFLELNGKRTGPFSPEQLLGLLADGEIPEHVTVHPGQGSETSGLTVAEMRDAYFHDDRIPTAQSPTKHQAQKAFQEGPDWDSSPSIPMAREESHHHEAAANLATSRRLFELFQTARDRRARFAPPSESQVQSYSSQTSWTRLRIPVAATLAAGIVVAAMGVRWTGSESKDEAQRQLAQSSSETQTPPPRVEPKQELRHQARAEGRPAARIQNTWKPSAIRPSSPAPRAQSVASSAPAPRAFQRPMAVPRPAYKPSRPQMPQQANPEANWADVPGGGAPTAEGNTQPYQPPEGQMPPGQLNNSAMEAGLNPGQRVDQNPQDGNQDPYQDPNRDPNQDPNQAQNQNQDGQAPRDYRVE